MKCEVFMFYGF